MLKKNRATKSLLLRGLGAVTVSLLVNLQPVWAAEQSCETVPVETGIQMQPQEMKRQATFAMKLLGTVAGDGRLNVSVSPFGIQSVLGELEIGASPAMRAAIGKTLQISPSDPNAVERLRKDARLLARVAGTSFVTADGLFVDNSVTLKPGMREVLEAEGGIIVRKLDFASSEDVEAVNRWAADHTGGRIQSILEPDGALSLAAINALHFKSCWQQPFDPAHTAERPFTGLDGTRENRTTMMAELEKIPYARFGRFDAVELPYTDDRFALTLITTNDKPASPATFIKAARLLWQSHMSPRKVRLQLPRFSGEADTDLMQHLSNLGLEKGLASQNQLSRFADGLKISAIHQKTFVVIDESGTEAAAATIASASRSVELDDEQVSISFDKPFVYALRHRMTGSILMMGYVADPR